MFKHTTNKLLLAATLWALSAPAIAGGGDLFLVRGFAGGNPFNSRFSAELLSVKDAELLRHSHIADHVDWINVDYDWRLLLVTGFKGDVSTISVISMDDGTVIQSCPTPKIPFAGLMDQWYSSPGGRKVYTQILLGNDPGMHVDFRGMLIGKDIRCEDAFFSQPPGDIRSYRNHGIAATGSPGEVTQANSAVYDDGNFALLYNGVYTEFGIKVPGGLVKKGKSRSAFVAAADDRIQAVYLRGSANEAPRALLRERGSGRWREIAADADARRAFPGFLTWMGARRMDDIPVGSQPGEANWKDEDRKFSPRTADRFSSNGYLYNGVLTALDIASGQLYRIETGEADSEVLLVEDRTIYYRVRDRLYRRTIGETALSAAELILRDPRILDVHWAFLGR